MSTRYECQLCGRQGALPYGHGYFCDGDDVARASECVALAQGRLEQRFRVGDSLAAADVCLQAGDDRCTDADYVCPMCMGCDAHCVCGTY